MQGWGETTQSQRNGCFQGWVWGLPTGLGFHTRPGSKDGGHRDSGGSLQGLPQATLGSQASNFLKTHHEL